MTIRRTVRRKVIISKPQRMVFDYLADPARHHEWNLPMLRTEMIDPGPIYVGTQAVEIAACWDARFARRS